MTAGADATVNYVQYEHVWLLSQIYLFKSQIYSTIHIYRYTEQYIYTDIHYNTYIQMHSLYIAATGTVLDYFWDSVCRMLQLMTQIFFFFRYDLLSKYFKIS